MGYKVLVNNHHLLLQFRRMLQMPRNYMYLFLGQAKLMKHSTTPLEAKLQRSDTADLVKAMTSVLHCAVGQKNFSESYVSQVSRYNITSILILYTSQVVRCIEHYTLSNVFSVISPVLIANHTGKSQENNKKFTTLYF